ncbi:MAG: flagellar assembly protein FliW, partial [Deltaproteobacteria bacterium]|nr:flagellar assembly protein FliW [Deltaproteobacteria bacterium]
MKIQTSRFGEIEIDAGTIIEVPGGLIGFPEEQKYLLIRHKPDSPFYWFQALNDPDLAFVIVNPAVFKPDYQIPYPASLLTAMKASAPEDLSLFVIVTIPRGNPKGMTANLLGPLVVNTPARLGKQLVLDENKYSHRYPLMSPSS